MSALFATIVISTTLLGQPAVDDPQPSRSTPLTGANELGADELGADELGAAATQSRIDQAIEDLGDDRFIVRKMASQALWRIGLAAEPALRVAATSRDREVRTRAQRILNDFDFGIVPGVPAETLIWIRQFRDGDPTQRQAAFARLLANQQFDIVESMLRLERDAVVRRALLVTLFGDENAIERFIELDRVETLIKTVGADQDERWRRTMMARVLSTPRMLTRLIELGKLNSLLEFIQNEQDALARKQLLLTVLRAPGTVAALIKNNQLDFTFTFLLAEKDKGVRGELLLVLLAAPEAMSAVLEQGKLDQVLEFARQNSETSVHKQILEQLFRTPNVVNKMLETRGIDATIAMVLGEKEPQTRGELLANLMMSRDMQKHLAADGKEPLVVELAEKETELAARRAYLDRLFQYGNILYSLKSPETLGSLWALVKSDPDPRWRTVAISRMLVTSRLTQLFDDDKEVNWLLDWLLDDDQREQRSKLLVAIVNNYTLKRKLIQQGHFGKLFELVKTEPDASRGSLLNQLMSSSDAAQYFTDKESTFELIALAHAFQDPKARNMYVSGLFRNHWAMTALVKYEHYDELAKLARGAENPVDRAILFGDFVRTQPVIAQLKENGELDSLIELASDEANPDAQFEFLKRLYANHNGLGALIEAGHFEKLLALARSTKQPARRDTLLAAFYGASQVVTALIAADEIESLLDFVKGQQDVNARRQVLQRLFYNQKAVGALVDKGHFETLLQLATAEKHPSYRASMIGTLLGSPPVVKYLTGKDRLGAVLNLVTREPDASSREQLLTYILSRSATVTALVDNGFLPPLLKLINRSTGSRREQLLGQVLLVPKVLELLAEQKRLSMVLAVVDAGNSGNGRTSYLQRLYYNASALTLLIKHGYFDDLLDVALAQKEPSFRALLLGRLFALELATQQLVQNGRVDFFLTAVKDEGSADARRSLLTQFVRSKPVIEALIEARQIDTLISLCLDDKDDTKRRTLLGELLASPKVLAQLADTNQLENVLTDVLSEKDQAKLRPILERLLTSTESMRLMAKHKQTDRLVKLVESGLSDNHRKALLSRLANNRSGVEWLAVAGKTDLLLATIAETSSTRRGYLLRNVLYTNEALQALLDQGGFDTLLKFVDDEPNDAMRRSMMASLLFSNVSLSYLGGAERLDEIFQHVQAEADDNLRRQCIQAFLYRSEGHALFRDPVVTPALFKLCKQETAGNLTSFVRQVMTVPKIRQGAVEAGQADVMREFAELEKDETRRESYLRELRFSPSGIAAWHIQRREYEQVERLLAEHAGDDLGKLRLAAYFRSRHVLDAKVDSMRRRADEAAGDVDSRQLLYLVRAQGDLAATRELATAIGDPGLLRAVMVESRLWGEAAALQDASDCPLPIPIPTTRIISANHEKMETLGYQATFQRLAGRPDDCAETVTKMLQLQREHPQDVNLAWHCAEALLLNDRIDDALAFLRQTHPRRAFALYSYQHRYQEAFGLVNVSLENGPLENGSGEDRLNRSWFDGLPSSVSGDDRQSQDRFEFALQVARVLNLLGRAADRDAVLSVLQTVVENLPNSANSSSNTNLYWELMCQSLVRMELYSRAWEVGARTITSRSSSPSVLSRIYNRRFAEANAWWQLLRAEQPGESVADALDRLHRVLYARPTEAAGEFALLAEQAEHYGETLSGTSQQSFFLGVGTTCRKRGEVAIALRCLERVDDYSSARIQRADLLLEQHRPLEAARAYEDVWRADHAQLAALYLAGHAYEQAGRETEAAHHRQLANELALDSRARHSLASALAERGLMAAAIEQWEFLRAAAPFEHLPLNDAARRLAMAQPEQPAQAADDWLHYMLGDLRNEYYMLESEGYLRVPASVHRQRAMAAVQAGRFDEAAQEIGQAADLTPGDTRLAEELVPAFENTGQADKAEALFSQLFERYEFACRQFPQSAYLHNNLAWLAARCGRKIEIAMAHASRAVELAPENGGYLDTLAEVHFRQGNRESAIRYSKLAVKYSPDQDSLREQLERFINDPLP